MNIFNTKEKGFQITSKIYFCLFSGICTYDQ